MRSKRNVGSAGPELGSELDASIQAKDGSCGATEGKKRRRMYSGVPSSSSGRVSPPTPDAEGPWAEGSFATTPRVPNDIVGPSSGVGGGRARAFLRGEGGADSYTWTSCGVSSANRSLRSVRLEGRVLLAEVGGGLEGREASAPAVPFRSFSIGHY